MFKSCQTQEPGAKAIVTIPFSARYHYIPYDYFRYTPSTLKNIFAAFKTVNIKPRGSDIIVISNKLIVLIVRNLKSLNIILLLPLLPMVFLFILASHVLLWLNLNKGGHIDPLGYTIILEK